MKRFSQLQSFGFTRNEVKVVLLLSMTFLVGVTLRHFNAFDGSKRNPEQQFNYAMTDSIFLERSKKARVIDEPETTRTTRPRGSRKESQLKGTININTATKQQLMQLPGIGEVFAERIIMYREDNGPFTSIDELEKIKGIGKKKLEQMRPYVSIK